MNKIKNRLIKNLQKTAGGNNEESIKNLKGRGTQIGRQLDNIISEMIEVSNQADEMCGPIFGEYIKLNSVDLIEKAKEEFLKTINGLQ